MNTETTLVERYRGGEIHQGTLYYPDGRTETGITASYLNRRRGQPYQACTAQSRYTTVEEARAAIDAAEAEQARTLAKFSALTYEGARRQGIGARWPKPAFWPPYDEVATVVHVGRRYILSAYQGACYLSMDGADWQYACALGDVQQFVNWFESPSATSDSCHYCGQAAVGFGFFGEPVCGECGGRDGSRDAR